MIKNLFNFNYEFSLIENLWLNHFIDFCFLLSFEDIAFFISFFYIFTISLINSSLLVNENLLKKIIFPFKIIIDFVIIYLILRSIFLINLFYLSDFFKDISNVVGFLSFYFWCVSTILILTFFPIFYLKFSNKLM